MYIKMYLKKYQKKGMNLLGIILLLKFEVNIKSFSKTITFDPVIGFS